jgi:hypothetical protein
VKMKRRMALVYGRAGEEETSRDKIKISIMQ